MIDELYIDGKEARSTYGVRIVKGGYNSLVAYAPLKSVKSIDWQEEDGIEVDLSAPVLDTNECIISFAVVGNNNLSFIDAMSSKAYHMFYVKSIGRTFRLRLVSNTNMQLLDKFGLFSLKFANDFPIDSDYAYSAPQSTINPRNDFSLDGVPLSDYGCVVLNGSMDGIDKKPDVKLNLLRNVSTQSGALYDDSRVTYKSKDVKINLLMRATTLSEFWHNYDALIYDLSKPELRSLYCAARSKSYSCYYKRSDVEYFNADGKIWFQFSITLVFV